MNWLILCVQRSLGSSLNVGCGRELGLYVSLGAIWWGFNVSSGDNYRIY